MRPDAAAAHRRRARPLDRSPSCFPAHPRTRSVLTDDGIELPRVDRHDRAARLPRLRGARLAGAVIATDSGGLQKEAYWYGVPCVTMRPSTEWIDTVAAGANVLVDDDPDRIAAAVADAREMPGRAAACSTATGTPPRRIADRRSAVRWPAVHRDVAIIGAGYVGVPLAQVFADAGRSVLLVDVSAERVAQLNRGESYIEDVPSEKLKQLVDERGPARDDRLRRAARGRRDPDRSADAALQATRAGPLDRAGGDRADRARGCARVTSSCSSRRPTPARRATRCCRSSSAAPG